MRTCRIRYGTKRAKLDQGSGSICKCKLGRGMRRLEKFVFAENPEMLIGMGGNAQFDAMWGILGKKGVKREGIKVICLPKGLRMGKYIRLLVRSESHDRVRKLQTPLDE